MRQKGFLPSAERRIGIHAEHQFGADVERRVVGKQAARVPAITALTGLRFHRPFQRTIRDGVDGVAGTSAAVVTVVVVAVELVRFERVFAQHDDEARLLRWRQLKFLCDQRAIQTLVQIERLFPAERLHPVPGIAAQKSRDEIRLLKVEHAPVVHQRHPRLVVPHDDRIVSELLEHFPTLPHRQQQHGPARPFDGALCMHLATDGE